MDRPGGDDRWQWNEPSFEPEPVPDGTADPYAQAATTRSGRRAAHQARTGSNRRVALIVGAVVLTVVVLGGGAFAVIRMLGLSSVDPAERLPDSVAVYFEVNLDPSFDQTPKLFDIIDTFGGFDEVGDDVEDFEDLIEEALLDLDVDFLEPSELTSWVGTRAALAGGVTADDQFYGVLALASRNDEAAESAMVKIVAEIDKELDAELGAEVGYVVDDGLVTVVLTDADAQVLAETLVADGRASPLAETDHFSAATEMFDGDQLLLAWYDLERYGEAIDDLVAQFEDELAAEGVAPFDVGAFDQAGGTWMALGAAATDNGIDIRYHSDGSVVESEIAPGWRDELAGLPMSQAAGVINLPKGIEDGVTAQLDLIDAELEELSSVLSGGALPNLEFYTRGQWNYDQALTDEEFAEWETLLAQWEAGELAEGDGDFDRLVELDDRFYGHGTKAEYDEWVAGGGESAEQWMFEQALTQQEYLEMDEYDTLARNDELPASDEERYYELYLRLYRYGLVSDYEFYEGGQQEAVDVRAMVEEIAELVSGAGVVFALEDAYADEPAGAISVTLDEGPADRIFQLPESGEYARELAAELGDALALEGPTITIGEFAAGDETLAEHPEFEAAFDGAPDDALWAVFVDVAALNDGAPEPEEWLEPVRAVSWVNGNQSGLIRILIDQPAEPPE